MKRMIILIIVFILLGLGFFVQAQDGQEKSDLWVGDNLSDKQIAKLGPEELQTRKLMKVIERARDVKFKHLIKVVSLDTAEFKAALVKAYGREMNAAGFCVDGDTVYVNRVATVEAGLVTDSGVETIVHEMVHALQYQLTDLKTKKERANTNELLHLMFAISEGEAEAVTWQCYDKVKSFAQGDFDKMGQITALRKNKFEVWKNNVRPQISDIVSMENDFFKNQIGTRFIDDIKNAQGWKAIDRMYTDKPVLSTEQILHPEKYTDPKQWDEPTQFEFPDLAKALGDGWAIPSYAVAPGMLYNTVGEHEMKTNFIHVNDTARRAEELAAGWDGDWLVTVIGPNKNNCEVWLSVWDSAKDAVEFTEALKIHRDKMIRPRVFESMSIPEPIKPALKRHSKSESEMKLYQTKGDYLHLEISGKYVLMIRTTDIKTIPKLLKALK